MSSPRKTLTCHDYTVGWISALPLEIAAARAMLDNVHTPLPVRENDNNVYYLGEIAGHNIVLTCLPYGVYGNTSATAAAIQMLSAFPSIKYGLLVGIGGGAPSTSNDIRLGDVVVSKPTAQFGGVVQYDFGKTLADGVFHQTGVLNKPPEALLKAAAQLQANHIMGKNNMPSHLRMAAETYPTMHESFLYPGQNQDVLFHASYPHKSPPSSVCEGVCDVKKVVDRKQRPSALPEIHYGLIASANQVMKDAKTRDRLSEKFGILCFDMEAAGLMDQLPCLVIRGISDYADSHKDRTWQKYAAATAAAYAKELLYTWTPGTIRGEQPTAGIKMKISIPKTTVFGRQHELQLMRECFSLPGELTKPVVLWGISGCGKTQLTLDYVDTEKDNYDSILRVDASSISVITDSFEQIARLIPSGFCPEKPAIERVLEWLEQDSNKSWILTYDNIPYVGDTGWDWYGTFDIRKYLPSCNHGHVVLVTTSCHLHSRLKFPGIHVQGLDEDAGSGVILRCANIESPDESTTATAKSISRRLGGLPLALEQAGSFLSYGLISMKEYSRRFEIGFRNETLKTHTRAYIGSYEKEQTLWAVFDMLHDTLGQRNSDALKLLHLAVFLGPGYVPFRVLVSGKPSNYPAGTSDNANSDLVTWLEDISNDFSRLPSALGEIENTGLVKFMRDRSDSVVDAIVIHDLVQSFIRAKMSRQEVLANAAASVFLNAKTYFSNGIMEDDEAMRGQIHRLSTVLDNFLSTVPRDLIQPPHGRYFMLFGSVAPLYARACRLKGELQKARDVWEICLQYRLVTEGNRWPKSEAQLTELLEAADVDLRLGNLGCAIEKYTSVVRHCRMVSLDTDNIMVRASASLREAREIHARRESDFQRAIATQRASKWPSEEPNQVSDIGDEEWEMIMRYEETLNLFGPRDAETLQHTSALAAYYMEHGAPAKEEKYREFIWKYHVASAGSSNPTTVAALFELCLCYATNGKLREKLRGDLYDAPVYARNRESSDFSRLLLEMETPDILAAFNNNDNEAFWNLLNRYDTMTAIFWASGVESEEIKDTLLYHFTKKDFPAVCLFLHLKAVYRQGSASRIPCRSDIDTCQSDIDFPRGLQQAVKCGYVSVVQGFLENNIDTSFADSSGKVALHFAAERGDILTVLMLLEHGADAFQVDCYGRTALHYAVKGRDTGLLKTLAENCGEAINTQDNHGETALHYASIGQDPSKVYLLANSGADVLLKDSNGDTPLHYATRGRRTESVKALLEFGSDPTQTNNDGQSALHCGLHAGLALFQLLLKYASDVSKTDSRGRAAIHYAAEMGYTDIVEALLDRAAKIDTVDYRGNTALHLAAGRGNHAVTQLLLNANANRFVENNFENTALELAFQGGHEKTVDLILSQSLKQRDPCGRSFLHRAAGKPEDMSFFYTVIGPSKDIINATDNHGRTALHVAAASGNLFAVQMLLDNGANHQIEGYGGESPLEDALMQRTETVGASKGDIALEEVIRLLRKAGSRPENAERRTSFYKEAYNDKASLEKGTWHGYSVDSRLI